MRLFKLLISVILILVFVVSFSFPCFAEETTYVWSENNTNKDNNTLTLESASAILIEQSTRASFIRK